MRLITPQQKAQIISLSIAGYNNRQIQIETGLKSGTLQYWKKQLRLSGINVPSQIGRPVKNSRQAFHSIATLEELNKEGLQP